MSPERSGLSGDAHRHRGIIEPVPDTPRGETVEEWQQRIGIGQRSNAIRSIESGTGTTRTTRVMRDDKPGVAGLQTDHWDGRKDAVVFPEHARSRAAATAAG